MEMDVLHRLPRIFAAVGHHPIALVQLQFPGQFGNDLINKMCIRDRLLFRRYDSCRDYLCSRVARGETIPQVLECA